MCLLRWWIFQFIGFGFLVTLKKQCNAETGTNPTWESSRQLSPPLTSEWSLHTRIPMTVASPVESRTVDLFDEPGEFKKGKIKHKKKKYKKYLFPLLLAYKLKFLAIIPVLVGGLLLLTGSTGLAGFFFALFAAAMSLKVKNYKK